jgi:hypothetical protein
LLDVTFIECDATYQVRVRSLLGVFKADFVSVQRNSTTSAFQPNYGMWIQGPSTSQGQAIVEQFDSIASRNYALYFSSLQHVLVRDSDLQGSLGLASITQATVDANAITVSSTSSYGMFLSSIGSSAANSLLAMTNNHVTCAVGTSNSCVYLVNIRSASSAVINNRIQNGHLHYSSSLSSSNTEIRDNIVQGSTRGGLYISVLDLDLRNNTLLDCHDTSAQGIILYIGAFGSNVNATSNSLQECSASMLLRLEGTSRYATTAQYIFQDNTITNCQANTAVVSLRSHPWSLFTRNIFDNCTAPLAVNLNLASTYTTEDFVDLPLNYWGATFLNDFQSSRSSVLDGFVTSTDPLVDFVEAYTDVALTATTPVPLPVVGQGDCGGILANQAYEFTAGDYDCSLSVIVMNNASLLISPGASLEFEESRGIVVHSGGTIQVAGAAGAPVTFRPGPAASTWFGIGIDSDSNVTITEAVFVDPEIGIRHTGLGTLQVASTSIQGSQSDCIQSSGTTSPATGLVILETNFQGCSSKAVRSSRGQRVDFVNTTVRSGGGITLTGNFYDCMLSGNDFLGIVGAAVQLSVSSSLIQVTGNTIIDSAPGVSISCSSEPCSVDIMDNVLRSFRSSSYSTDLMNVQASNAGRVRIADNLLEGHETTRSALTAYFSASRLPESGLSIVGNVFQNLTAANIVDITYASTRDATQIGGNVFGESLDITSTSNPAVVVIRDWPTDTGATPVPGFVGNTFSPSLSNETFLVEALPSEPAAIDASYTFWGTTNEASILQGISDGRDVFGRTVLDYIPFRLTSQPGGPIQNSTSLGFVRPGNVIGGRIEAGEVVTLSNGTYYSDGNIFVDGSLTILPGVTIVMDIGTSLVIEAGSFVANGTFGNPIRIEAQSPSEAWGQLKIELSCTYHEIENLVLSHAGANSVYALDVESANNSSLYRNVSIINSSSGGLYLDAFSGSIHFDGLWIRNCSGDQSAYVLGSSHVTMMKAFLSNSPRTAELRVSGSTRLILDTVSVDIQSTGVRGLYLENRFALISNYTFDSSFPISSVGPAVYVYSSVMEQLELSYSRVHGSKVNGAAVSVYASPSCAVLVSRNTFLDVGELNGGTFVEVVRAGEARLVGNIFSGTSVSVASGFRSGTASQLVFDQNQFIGIHVEVPHSLITLDSDSYAVTNNVFVNCTGHTLFEIAGGPSRTNISDNAIIDCSSMNFYVHASTPYENVLGGIYYVGANFWDTLDFAVIFSKTFDSRSDPSLATVAYEAIHTNADMVAAIQPPASLILNEQAMTISGAIHNEVTLIVPAGIYFVPGSIVLRHPKAILILEAGAYLLFAPGGTLRIDEGTLKILGSSSDSVKLTGSADALEYGFVDFVNQTSEDWGGIMMNPMSNSSLFISGEYIDGSIIRHCIIKGAGNGDFDGSIYLDQTSILVEHVFVNSSNSNGIYLASPDEAVFLRDINVTNANGHGIYLEQLSQPTDLANIQVSSSYRSGLYVYNPTDLFVSNSRFQDNYRLGSTGTQVYVQGPAGQLSFLDR